LFYEPFSFIFYFFRTFPLAGQFVVYDSGDFRVCAVAKFSDARRQVRGRERTMSRQRLEIP
jgi:hypothetical protein